MMVGEEELVARSKEGDLASFNQLVERYQQQVYNLSLRMLGNHEDAEDTAQETFILAWKAIGKLRGGSFRAWLLRIASNACTDLLRSGRRRRVDSLDSLFPDYNPLPSTAPSPEDYAVQGELREVITRCLLTIPEDQRFVVILADLQGMSYEEIAQTAGISMGTVKSRLSRGRASVRDALLQYREHLPPEYRL